MIGFVQNRTENYGKKWSLRNWTLEFDKAIEINKYIDQIW